MENYDNFTIDNAVDWLRMTAPDVVDLMKPATFEQVEKLEECIGKELPEQLADLFDVLGGERFLMPGTTWAISIDTMIKWYHRYDWVRDPEVVDTLMLIGYKVDAQQYNLYFEVMPFGYLGALLSIETLTKESALDESYRRIPVNSWTVAGSVPELLCLPVFRDRIVVTGESYPPRWFGKSGQCLLQPARDALVAAGFTLEPFSTNYGAALRRGEAAVTLFEQELPTVVTARGSATDIQDIEAVLQSVGVFEDVTHTRP